MPSRGCVSSRRLKKAFVNPTHVNWYRTTRSRNSSCRERGPVDEAGAGRPGCDSRVHRSRLASLRISRRCSAHCGDGSIDSIPRIRQNGSGIRRSLRPRSRAPSVPNRVSIGRPRRSPRADGPPLVKELSRETLTCSQHPNGADARHRLCDHEAAARGSFGALDAAPAMPRLLYASPR